MEKIIIIGSSGHSKVAIDIIEKTNQFEIIGLIDSYRDAGEKTDEYTVLGGIPDLPRLKSDFNISSCFIAIGDNWNRLSVYNEIEKLNISFNYPAIIDKSASVGKNTTIGRGSIIMPMVTINAHSQIDEFTIINTKTSVDHDSYIGSFASLGPGVTTGGEVTIEELTHIGIGTILKNKVKIGSNTVIGAGSLVLKNQPSYYVCYGSPCVPVRTRNTNDKYL